MKSFHEAVIWVKISTQDLYMHWQKYEGFEGMRGNFSALITHDDEIWFNTGEY